MSNVVECNTKDAPIPLDIGKNKIYKCLCKNKVYKCPELTDQDNIIGNYWDARRKMTLLSIPSI